MTTPRDTAEARERADFRQALDAFDVMSDEERLLVLKTFAGLRYPKITDRFFEAVHRVICESEGLQGGTGGA